MTIVQNKKAQHDYSIEERYEAGIALEGWEVKSIRANQVQLNEAYVVVRSGELYLLNSHISPLSTTSTHVKAEPTRTRKLLLHAAEIRKLIGKVERAGYSLVPLNMHYSKGRVKLEVGLAKGKRQFEKRADRGGQGLEEGAEPTVEATQPLDAQQPFQNDRVVAVLVIASQQLDLHVSVLAVKLPRGEVGFARFDTNRRDSRDSRGDLKPVEQRRRHALPTPRRVNRHQQQMRVFFAVLHDREAGQDARFARHDRVGCCIAQASHHALRCPRPIQSALDRIPRQRRDSCRVRQPGES